MPAAKTKSTSAKAKPARPKPKPAPARKRARARRSSITWAPRMPVVEQRHMDLFGLALVAAGVFLAFGLYLRWDAGEAGDGVTSGLRWLFGDIRFGVPPAVAAAGALVVLRPVLPTLRPFRAGAVCLFAAALLAVTAGTFGLGPGGAHGEFWQRASFEARGGISGEGLYYATSTLLGSIGTHIVCVFLFVAGVLLITGASVAGVFRATASVAVEATGVLRSIPPVRRTPGSDEGGFHDAPDHSPMTPPEPDDVDLIIRSSELDGALRYPDLFGDDDGPSATDTRVPEPAVIDPVIPDLPEPDEPAAHVEAEPEHDPEPTVAVGEQARLDLEEPVEWTRPGTDLLKHSTDEQKKPDTRGQEATAERLLQALAHFNVEAKLIGTVTGPHITRYELRLAPGIKMSKVAQMKDDLAYALAATEIRILAPIPGKTAVGVEVPNANRKMVTLGDVYGGAPKGSSPLTVWLGKDVSGAPISADLAKMPHLLVAGTTGAGKSGCINAMLSSILLRATPEEVRLILVDPKQVELNHYEAVPHLLTPVITSPRAAANALQNLVKEMEWRYGVMSMARTRSLPELNKYRHAKGDDPLPYILCVIDELADLMMVAPADVEDSIIRIAQKARAVGIHLVLATQSPRVDVITGMIKANVPSRIAFSVSSQTDSRVILDQNGAESLLGMGDMLFSAVGSSKLHRIQGAYIDEPQIEKLTAFWARQGEPEIREDLLAEVEPEEKDVKEGDGEFDPDEDPLLGDAIALVVEMGTASTSMLQRRLRLGYTRAGRLIDMLERRGVISGYEGSKPRQVLVTAMDLPRVLANLSGTGVADDDDSVPELDTVVVPPLPDEHDILGD
jgi:S-DNA-T family DNA segregation ATPase FtsK/SpoIIIE